MLTNLVVAFAVDILSFRLFSSVEIVGERSLLLESVAASRKYIVNSGNVSD